MVKVFKNVEKFEKYFKKLLKIIWQLFSNSVYLLQYKMIEGEV